MRRDFSRQTFLPSNSEETLASIKVGVVGLCGGGSHIVQQLAHIGILNYVLADCDFIDGSNLNRLVGATAEDVSLKSSKAKISERIVRQINPTANIKCIL